MDRSHHWITVFAVVLALVMWAVAPVASADAYARLFEVQKKVAEAGDASGQLHLGEMYELGLGTKPDHDEAMKWYRRAAKQGHPLAQRRIDALRQAEEEDRFETALEGEVEQTKTTSVAPSPVAEPKVAAPKPAPGISAVERKVRREAKAKDDEARRRALVQEILARQRKNARDTFE